MFNKKILCLGNNSKDTNCLTQNLADKDNTQNNGLISSGEFVPKDFGYYHTSILDLSFGQIIATAKHFDSIVLLDQPKESWSHWKPLLCRVTCGSATLQCPVQCPAPCAQPVMASPYMPHWGQAEYTPCCWIMHIWPAPDTAFITANVKKLDHWSCSGPAATQGTVT